MHSERKGQGQPLILIHGFCEDSSIWNPLRNKLALSHEVITLDLPGFGNSPLNTNSFTIDDIADQVYQWIKENELLGSVIIGHSLGGYVALAIADKYPNAMQGFGLLHSTAYADDEEKRRSRDKTAEFVQKNGVELFANSFVNQLFYHKNRKRLSQEIIQVTTTARNTTKESLIRYLIAMRDRPDRSSLLTKFKKPILFISGTEDSAVPIDKSRSQYELIANPFITELNEVGHMGMYEDPIKCFTAIIQFMSQFKNSDGGTRNPGVLPDRSLKKNLGCG